MALAATPTRKQAFYANMLVQIRPLDTITLTEQLPIGTFGVACRKQARIPRQWHTQATPIS
jgi:hypothetical protein